MVEYRLANETDYININDFHNRLFSSNRTIEQFYWEFQNCPHGKSIYIIAEDGNKVVGTNCVIPIELIDANNNIILTGKSEDTLVDPAYRGQNIFYNIYQKLFEECEKSGIRSIWGFTSAAKPFGKLGFDIPYDHKQSLAVNKVTSSYKYLSGLNVKNRFIDRIKIFGLCTFSKLKMMQLTKTSIIKKYRISRENVLDGVLELIKENLKADEGSFAINQSSDFQNWRIYQNPNYSRVHTFGFYDDKNILQGLIVLNSHPNKIAYICHSTFHNNLAKKDVIAMIKYATKEIFGEGIALIRNWNFTHNSYKKKETEAYIKARYVFLNRGIGFVWKELGDFKLDPKGFQLSRIASQGVK